MPFAVCSAHRNQASGLPMENHLEQRSMLDPEEKFQALASDWLLLHANLTLWLAHALMATSFLNSEKDIGSCCEGSHAGPQDLM